MTSVDGAQDMIRCELCENPVKFHCNTCVACLCKECVGKHITENISVQHDIIEFKSRMSEPVHQICTEHANQSCSLHCKQCEISVCLKCLSNNHRMHDVEELSEMCSKIRIIIQEDTKELEEKIITEIEDILKKLQNKKLKLKEEYQPARTGLAEQGERWHKEVERVIQKYKSRLDEEEEKDKAVIDKHISDLNIVLSQARQKIQENRSILKSNTSSGLTGYRSRNSEFRVVPPKIDTEVPKFMPHKLENNEVDQKFGTFEFFKDEYSKQASLESTTTKNACSTQKLASRLMNQARVSMTIEDYGPVQCLNSWSLLIGSEIYDFEGNKCSTLYIFGDESMSLCPIDLTVTREGDIIYTSRHRVLKHVTCAKSSETSFYDEFCRLRYPEKAWDRRTILHKNGWEPHGLCCTNDNDILVCLINNTLKQSKIVRIQLQTKAIKQEIQYENGKSLFNSHASYMFIAQNKNGDICVSSWDMPAAVTVLTDRGKIRFRYYGNLESETYGSFDPRGIVTDESCQILVADKVNKCIHILDKDGQFLKYINNCHLQNPLSLGLDRLGRLIVENETKNVTIIKYLRRTSF